MRGVKLGVESPITPARPTLVRFAPTDPGWVHEIKYDGYRIVAVRQGVDVRLWSRSGKDLSSDFPGIRDAVLSLPVDEFVIDGEAVAHNAEGYPDFYGLRSRVGRKYAVLFAFDLLSLGGDDIRRLPLLARKERLQALLLGASDRLRFVEHLESDGKVVFEHASALGLEGIVSKRADSRYTHGATRNWVKVKNRAYGRRRGT